jgi:hypothetical protein
MLPWKCLKSVCNAMAGQLATEGRLPLDIPDRFCLFETDHWSVNHPFPTEMDFTRLIIYPYDVQRICG